MSERVIAVSTIEELQQFVRAALCEQDALDERQTAFYQTPLLRRGRPIGILFHAEGPRLLKTSAVWMADEARIVFYNSSGLRTREIKLIESPELSIAIPDDGHPAPGERSAATSSSSAQAA